MKNITDIINEAISRPKLTDTETITKSWETLVSQVEKYFSFSKKPNKDFPLGYYEFMVNVDKKPWVIDMFDRVWCILDQYGDPYFATQYAGHPDIRKNFEDLHSRWTKGSTCGHYDPNTNTKYMMSFGAPHNGVCKVCLMIKNKNA